MNGVSLERVRVGRGAVVHLRVVEHSQALVEDWSLFPRFFDHLPEPGELLCGNRGDARPSSSAARVCRRCEVEWEDMEHDLAAARQHVGLALAERVAREW
jgi:hypothetical protein